jgi:hypothetical protein
VPETRASRYDQLKRPEIGLSHRSSGNVVPLAVPPRWHPSVKYVAHVTAPTLHIEPEPHELYDVTFLLVLPNLWKPFAEGLLRRLSSPRVRRTSTRNNLLFRTRCYLTRYLVESGQETLTLEEMNRSTVNGYVAWLSSAQEDGKFLAHSTRAQALTPLRAIIEELRAHPNYTARISKRLSFSANPWPGWAASRKPTRILSDEEWHHLYEICSSEVSETVAMITRQWDEIAAISERVKLNKPTPYYREETVFLAALGKALPGAIPTKASLYETYPSMARALQAYHGFYPVRVLHPTMVDLLPFIVLLQLYTNYNAEQLLSLELDSIERQVVIGTERMVLSPYKARARRKQIRSFAIIDDPTSVPAIVDFLIAWTRRIRTEAPREYRDRLFLYFNFTRGKSLRVRSFGRAGCPASDDHTFHRALSDFFKRRGLRVSTLKELRATGLEFVHQLFSGDLRAVQAAGGQRRPQVINDHYTSDAARRRNDERLADVMATRERWQASDGRVDPRGTPEHQDLGACTPEWACADPYASPIPGERTGRLCGAFGACPGCPLASINPTLPSALANLLTLKREIENAQTYLPAQRWMQAWAPRLARLNDYWLPSFENPAVVDAAARLTLPRFPRLD